MPLASLIRGVLAYAAPVLYGLRQWRAATRRDDRYLEDDRLA